MVMTANAEKPGQVTGVDLSLMVLPLSPMVVLTRLGSDNTKPYGGDKASQSILVWSPTLSLTTLVQRMMPIQSANGLTLNAVGNGTKIENVVVRESADDAIEFFGGTVNVTNFVSINADDDMFDFTEGYSGTLKNAYGIWDENHSSTGEGPTWYRG